MIEVRGCSRADQVKNIIELYFEDWKFTIDDQRLGERFKFKFKIDQAYNQQDLYRVLSDAIEEVIIVEYLDDIIESRLNRIYEGENLQPGQKTINRIKDEIKTSSLYLDEKIKMKEELVDYMSESRSIDIYGYMRFRLTDYIYILDIAIDNVITQVKEEVRVREFLDMIKYLVDSHPSKESILNVIIKDGDFSLKDAENNRVGSDIIDRVERDFENVRLTKSDLLLSVLILMSPKRIVLHTHENKNSFLIKTIREVFEGRIVFCSGCNICKLNSKID